jgi:hypothetical protein
LVRNAVRLQLHALANNMANFLRTLALPGEVKQWSLTVKIGAKNRPARKIGHVPDAEVTVLLKLFQQILAAIATTTTITAGTMLRICAVAATSGSLGSRCAERRHS